MLSLFNLQAFESVVQGLCLNKYTPTTTRIGYNNVIYYTANNIESLFQKIRVTNMESVFITDRDSKTTTMDTMAIKDNDAAQQFWTYREAHYGRAEMVILVNAFAIEFFSTTLVLFDYRKKPKHLYL